MEKKELLNKIIDFSSDLMEKHFPKGECKERGQALVFNAEMIVYISDLFDQELDKAREEGFREGRMGMIETVLNSMGNSNWTYNPDIHDKKAIEVLKKELSKLKSKE